MTVDLVLKGGKIATPTGIVEAGIAVDGEQDCCLIERNSSAQSKQSAEC